ncbi:hypothetical protein [Methanosphaera sp. BMS]|uniref:hypothetical protein n=1 Tax=Methanosphaera sp. BMS TaxID=1789762 RepID=UPI000DC1DAC5|nr:hypothetical protein [Methanosphaera sp. BMS]AWX32765.1 hypothetical protein AW729_06470 [Methanosphaera sp. BMS]
MKTIIDAIILDGKYETDDYKLNVKLVIDKLNQLKMYVWDGLEWSDKKGLNRVYTDETSQIQYDDFVDRLVEIEKNRLLYEIAKSIDVDQSYYFEKERLYLYIENKTTE